MTHERIDDLARALPPYRPSGSRVEQVRTAVLAGAPTVAQQRAPRRGAYVAGAVLALAAAAALAWTLRPPRDAGVAARVDHATVVAVGDASYDLGDAPDEIVRVTEGEVHVVITPVGADERVRIVVGDAELETRGGAVDLAVHADHLQWVVSRNGQVEVRPERSEAVLLDTGERWDAPKLAVETTPPPPTPTVAEPIPAPVEAPAPSEPSRKKPTRVQRSATTPSTTAMPPAAPGEAEFRAGWASLKAGDPAAAADSFEAARVAKGSAVAEDASFWEGIALARAGKTSKATAALRRFLSKYPSSSRAGEAAAKLGWLLYDAGDLDAAERYFRAAADDVVPKVQKSARDGLTAVERSRKEGQR